VRLTTQEGRLIVCNPGLRRAWILNAYAEPAEILDAGRGISLTNVALHPSGIAYFTDSTNGRILRAQL